MKITALVENTAGDPRCGAEHGLSLYIETDRHKILFDTGQSGLFIQNAGRLGIDLEQVDVAILSHGHFDHAGGMTAFLRLNRTCRVYANRGVQRRHYNALQKYIGLEPALIGEPRITLTGDELEIDDQLKLKTYNQMPPCQPAENYGITEEQDGELRPDPFLHEHYLLIREHGRCTLVSGCTHKGICNLLHWSREETVHTLVGGFHFMNVEPEEYYKLDEAARQMRTYPVQYYTCHCTGLPQYHYLKGKLGDQLAYLAGGQTIEV